MKSKVASKFQPFLENIVIGSLFVFLGRYIMTTFNENAFGHVGLVAIMWGGVKLFIGVVIYGIALWALVFRPDSFKNAKQDKMLATLLKRVTGDLQSNNIARAKDRLHGAILKYPNNIRVKHELAKLYLLEDDSINAGRYLYLKSNLSKREKECISNFETSKGNDSFHILRSITKPSKIDAEFVNESSRRLAHLVRESTKGSHAKSWIVRAYASYLEALNIPWHRKLWRDEKDIIVNVAILVSLFLLTLSMSS